jgi:hypothetical protein
MINSVAFLGSSNSNNTLVKQAQTQTERKLSCLKQFIYCLLANQVSEKHTVCIKEFDQDNKPIYFVRARYFAFCLFILKICFLLFKMD